MDILAFQSLTKTETGHIILVGAPHTEKSSAEKFRHFFFVIAGTNT